MSTAFFSFKGGVGKTSLATAYTLTHDNKTFVTNDITQNLENMGFSSYVKLPENKKTIVPEILHSENVFDLGAMNGQIDPKVISPLKHSSAVVIPTLTDVNSINATIESIKEAKHYVDVIIVVINKVRKKDRRYHRALDAIRQYLPTSHILMMKETTLYDRLALDGAELLNHVGHAKGVGQLSRTIEVQTALFNRIDTLIIEGTRIY